MITYVDTSTLLKLLIEEVGTAQAQATWDRADDLVSAPVLQVEARAALTAAARNEIIVANPLELAAANSVRPGR